MIELWNIFQAASITEADADPMFVKIQTLTKGDVFVSKQSHQELISGKCLYVKKKMCPIASNFRVSLESCSRTNRD